MDAADRGSRLFFVTGFPRSGTAWMANLLTDGTSVCLHDVLLNCGNVEQLAALMKGYDGVSDPALALVWPDVARRWPKARWIVMRRDGEEALESYERFLREHGASMGSAAEREVVGGAIAQRLDEVMEHCDALEVRLEDLKDENAVEAAYRFATGRKWGRGRWEVVRRLNVQTIAPAQLGNGVIADWVMAATGG
jgi:hypothetical protein